MKGTITRPLMQNRADQIAERQSLIDEMKQRGLKQATVHYGTLAERMKRSKKNGKPLPKAELEARKAELRKKLKK